MHFVSLKGNKKSTGTSNITQTSCDVLFWLVMSGMLNENVTISGDETRQLGVQPGKYSVLAIHNQLDVYTYYLLE